MNYKNIFNDVSIAKRFQMIEAIQHKRRKAVEKRLKRELIIYNKKRKIDGMDIVALHMAYDCYIKLPKSSIEQLDRNQMLEIAYSVEGIKE